jgi:trehalose synthase
LTAPGPYPLQGYQDLIGAEAFDRLLTKAERVRDLHVVNVSSTYYGGGVAELLSSLTLFKNELGVRCGWRAIQGRPDFFSITKKVHNALQGGEINFSDLKVQIYEEVIWENALRTHFDHDFVIVHDPQPLGMIQHYRRKGPWIWRCHVELSSPDPELWRYMTRFIEQYDAVIFSVPEYAQNLTIPQLFFMPAIDPFSAKNRDLSDQEIDDRLGRSRASIDGRTPRA